MARARQYIREEQDGRKLLVAHIVRAANNKSVRDIHQEIRAVQTKPSELIESGYGLFKSEDEVHVDAQEKKIR